MLPDRPNDPAIALGRLLTDRAHGATHVAWLATAALVGVLIGVGLGVADPDALLWGAVLAAGVLVLAWKIATPGDRPVVIVIAALALAVHMSAALVIQAAATGFGGGFVTGDDAAYFRLSSEFARYLHDLLRDPLTAAPEWGLDGYLFGTFVYLESGLLFVFGPDVRFPLLMNAALAVVSALLVYATTVRLFSQRGGVAALLVVAFWPSLVVWSALNLKDTLAIVLVVAAMAAMVSFHDRPRGLTFLIPIGVAGALLSLRPYVAAIVALAAVTALFSARLGVRWRLASGVAAAGSVVAVVVMGMTAQAPGPGDQLISALERSRHAMAIGARTAFVAPPSPTVARAAVGTSLSIPGADPDPLLDDTPIFERTLAYLPTGVAFALFAPFPWTAHRPQELLAAPEVLLWYGLVAAAAVSLRRERRRWRALLPLAVLIFGLLAVLVLAEGNVGTLFRHRDTLVVLVAVLASPTLATVWTWAVRGRRSPRRSRAGKAETLIRLTR
jgi:hypothetical protein